MQITPPYVEAKGCIRVRATVRGQAVEDAVVLGWRGDRVYLTWRSDISKHLRAAAADVLGALADAKITARRTP